MPESEEQASTNYAGLIIFVCTLPVLFFFAHIGKTDLGLNVGICLGIMVFAVGMCWDLRKYFWFWIIIVILLVLHVPPIFLIQWPHIWVPRIALLPIGLADLLIDVGVVRLAAKLMLKTDPSDEG